MCRDPAWHSRPLGIDWTLVGTLTATEQWSRPNAYGPTGALTDARIAHRTAIPVDETTRQRNRPTRFPHPGSSLLSL